MAMLSRDSEPLQRASRSHRRVQSGAERWWVAMGAHPDFVESVFGDLEEEFASRASSGRAFIARAWYVREAMRSAPYLLWSGVRYGTRQQRLRMAALLAGVMTLSVAIVLAIVLSDGPPARLVAGS